MGQSIEKYREGNGGRAPSSVVVYRDGVRGASDYASAGREGEAVAAAIRSATGMGSDFPSDLLLSQLDNMLSHMVPSVLLSMVAFSTIF